MIPSTVSFNICALAMRSSRSFPHSGSVTMEVSLHALGSRADCDIFSTPPLAGTRCVQEEQPSSPNWEPCLTLFRLSVSGDQTPLRPTSGSTLCSFKPSSSDVVRSSLQRTSSRVATGSVTRHVLYFIFLLSLSSWGVANGSSTISVSLSSVSGLFLFFTKLGHMFVSLPSHTNYGRLFFIFSPFPFYRSLSFPSSSFLGYRSFFYDRFSIHVPRDPRLD